MDSHAPANCHPNLLLRMNGNFLCLGGIFPLHNTLKTISDDNNYPISLDMLKFGSANLKCFGMFQSETLMSNAGRGEVIESTTKH